MNRCGLLSRPLSAKHLTGRHTHQYLSEMGTGVSCACSLKTTCSGRRQLTCRSITTVLAMLDPASDRHEPGGLRMKLAGLLAGLLVAFSATTASAQNFPTRAVTLISPYAAGGSADMKARALAEVLQDM